MRSASPISRQLEDRDVEGVYEYLVRPALHEFASSVFEDVCREFVRGLQKKNALPIPLCQDGALDGKTTVRDKNAETDCGWQRRR